MQHLKFASKRLCVGERQKVHLFEGKTLRARVAYSADWKIVYFEEKMHTI